MDLTLYDIIKGPRITEKAYRLNQQEKKLVLEVHPHANKPLIAEALKKLFNVEAEKIGILVKKGKKRRAGRFFTVGKTRKIAIVTLKEGQSVDFMGLAESQAAHAGSCFTRESIGKEVYNGNSSKKAAKFIITFSNVFGFERYNKKNPSVA